MKYKAFVFGTGKGSKIIEHITNTDNVEIVGYIDNNRKKQGSLNQGKRVYSPAEAIKADFDYIFISTVDSDVIGRQLTNLGVDTRKLISVFQETYDTDIDMNKFFMGNWECDCLRQFYSVRVDRLEKRITSRLENIPYEIADKIRTEKIHIPIVINETVSVQKIINEKCSVCRFGDFEFEMILGRVRCNYQMYDKVLSQRLTEVLHSRQENVMIAIANNYGSLEKYEEDAKDAIRCYLSPKVRNEHILLLEEGRTYYDAYLSRPYIIYKDKENAGTRFAHLKQIWENREVVIIEGNKTRMGIGNDLFDNAKCMKRIIAPNENAFIKYEKIFNEAIKQPEQLLFLLSLGPTATVLAYDLAKAGYQAVDIGQIDNEYEWFQRGVSTRVIIPGKYVNEVSGGDQVESVEVRPIDDVIAYIEG